MEIETDKCGNCREEVTVDSDFCPHCGVLFDKTPVVACETDPSQEASGVCIICQKPVCETCSFVKFKRLFCQVHKDVVVVGDDAVVYESIDPFQAELVVGLLKSGGFSAIVQRSNRAHGAETEQFWISFSSGRRYENRVFVPIPDYFKAIELLQSKPSEESDSSSLGFNDPRFSE